MDGSTDESSLLGGVQLDEERQAICSPVGQGLGSLRRAAAMPSRASPAAERPANLIVGRPYETLAVAYAVSGGQAALIENITCIC
jgi:hypothetical protein